MTTVGTITPAVLKNKHILTNNQETDLGLFLGSFPFVYRDLALEVTLAGCSWMSTQSHIMRKFTEKQQAGGGVTK